MITATVFSQCSHTGWSNGYGGTITRWQSLLGVTMTRVNRAILASERLKHMPIPCTQHVFSLRLFSVQVDNRHAANFQSFQLYNFKQLKVNIAFKNQIDS